MAISNLALFGSAFLTPVVAGKITTTIGWSWTFYLVTILSAVMLPFVFLFVPETAYRRSTYTDEGKDISSSDSFSHAQQHSVELKPNTNDTMPSIHASSEVSHSGDDNSSRGHSTDLAKHVRGALPPKVSFVQSLLPFNGRKTDDSFFKLFLRPFPLFFHPAILWVSCHSQTPRQASRTEY